MAKKGFNPLRTGVDPRSDTKNGGGKGNWLKMKANEVADVTILVEAEDIIACEQCAIWRDDGNSPVWVYTGPDDPSHELGVEKRYKAFLPVLHGGEAKIFPLTKTMHNAVLDVADAAGTLQGLNVRIKRTGQGLTTKYSIVPRGTMTDVSDQDEVDVPSVLGPLDPEGVRSLIAEKFGYASYEDVLDLYRGRAAKAKAEEEDEPVAATPKKPAKKKAAPVVEEEEEELDGLELR